MKHVSVSVRRDDDGLLVTLVCVDRAMAHFRRFRRPAGTAYEDLAHESARMAMERWPGGIMWRMPLPLGDCGHVE